MSKIIQNKNFKWICLVLYFLLYFALFFYKKVISFDKISHVLMAAIILVNWYYFFNKTISKIKYTRIELIFLIIVNLCISFFVSGKVLFLTDSVVSISLLSILFYLLTNIFIFPFVCNLLYLLDNSNVVDKKRKSDDSKKFALKIFAISFAIMIVACIAFYPGNITSDTVDQIAQATGQYQINNVHPALNAIIIKILMSIWNNPFVVVIGYSLFLSLVLTHIYKFLYEQKANEKFLYISLLVFMLSINNLTMITMAWKDIPFTIALLWLTFEAYKIVKLKDDYFKSMWNIVLFIIPMTLSYFLRYNGMFPYILMILYLIYIIFKSKVKLRIATTIVLCFASVWTVKGPVYDFFDVAKSDGITGGAASFAAKGLGALIYYDGNLSEEDLETISKLADLDDLREFYYAYSIDTYSFQDIKFSEGIDRLGVAKIYEMYVKHFFKNPDIIIRDRLDGSNLLWSYDTPVGGFNYKYDYGVAYPDWVKDFNGMERNEGNSYIPKANLLKSSIEIYQKGVNKVKLLDSFFWRGGIILSILLVLLYFVFIRKIHILPAMYPTLISVLFWFALMNHQSYRYIWFLYVNTFFLVIFALLEKKNKVVKW